MDKVTITTIAQATGLSLATVSRALSGAPNVTPATRAKVVATAKSMNYIRDRAAVRLKTGKTHVMAFIMERLDTMQPGFKDMLLGLTDAVRDTEYHLIALPESLSEDPLHMMRYVVERRMADALILTHTTPHDPRVRYLLEHRFPFITHGRTDFQHLHASVDFDNEAFARIAVEQLYACGRRRLGVLLPQAGGSFHLHLKQGFLDACRQHGLPCQVITEINLDSEPEQIHHWMQAHAAEFDGLVITREASLLPLLRGLSDAGVVLRKDIDVVAKYSSSLPRYMRQPIWLCFEDLYLAGKTMGQQLLADMYTPNTPPPEILFQPPPLENLYEQA